MQATATRTAQRDAAEPNRARALVRFNALTFHSAAAASFLETAAPLHANHLARMLGACPEARLWLEQVWWPQRAELGRRLREYVEAIWPELDWSAAYQEFYESYRPRYGVTGRRGGIAHVALGLCVTAAQAAVFYRALANAADDPALRALARQAARDHSDYFDFFRTLFDRCKRIERIGFIAAWRAAAAVCRLARDVDVAAAFEPLGRNWNGASVVPAIGYPEYRQRMAQFVQRYSAIGWIERLLFRAWLQPARMAPAVPAPEARAGRWLPLAIPAGSA